MDKEGQVAAMEFHPCPCTHPELPQFERFSQYAQTGIKGKRLLWQVWFSFAVVLYSSLSHRLDLVLKALHTNRGILTDKECSDCASKGTYWYQLTGIVIATKPPDVVHQTLDVVRDQSAINDHWTFEGLAKLLKGRPTLQLIRIKE